MALCQCEYCQKYFSNYDGQKICADCSKELDDIFKKIRKFMYMTSARVTAATIVEELDVPEKAVEYLLRENRLILERGNNAVRKCKVCGAPVAGDMLCLNCRKKFSDSVKKFNKDQEEVAEPHRRGGANPLIRSKNDIQRQKNIQPIKRNRED